MPEPKLMTEKQGRDLIEQNAEIIRRMGILIVLLAPKRPGSEIDLDVTRMEKIAQQAEAMATAIKSEYVR